MIYERLDHAVRTKVLAVTGNRVLIDARWLAQKSDIDKFQISHGIARNITVVTREYFERKYGAKL